MISPMAEPNAVTGQGVVEHAGGKQHLGRLAVDAFQHVHGLPGEQAGTQFVPGENRLVEERDPGSALGEQIGGRGTGRSGPDNDGVMRCGHGCVAS